MKKLFTLFVLFLFSCAVSSAQENKTAVTQKLDVNLYLIKKAGVNSVILFGDDGTLLVDDNTEASAKSISDEIKNITDNNLKYIINTHWHFDHTEGNKVLGKGVTIIAHEEVKTLLSNDELLLGDLHKAYPDYALPSITFTDKYNLYLNGETVEITGLSGGHTGGDAVVYFKKSNVLHIGDIVFADMFSFIDTDHGGNILKLSENIQKILDAYPSDVKIIPGHGRILTKYDLIEYKEMIDKTTEIIRKEMSLKKTLEEIKSENPLTSFSKWQVAFSCEDWIEYIYYSLK